MKYLSIPLLMSVVGCASAQDSGGVTRPDHAIGICDAAAHAAENYGRIIDVEGTYQQTPHGGTIFSSSCNVFAALRLSDGFEWKGAGASAVLALTKDNDARRVHVTIKGEFEKAGPGECYGALCYRYQLTVIDILSGRPE